MDRGSGRGSRSGIDGVADIVGGVLDRILQLLEYRVNYIIPDEFQSTEDLSIEVLRPANRSEVFGLPLQRVIDEPGVQGVADFVAGDCSYHLLLLSQSDVASVAADVSCGIEHAPPSAGRGTISP